MISTFAFLYFYAGWFAAIFLAKTEHAWISLLLPLGMILCFLKLRLLTPKLLALGLATSIFGAVFDSLMSQTKLISVHGQTSWLIPSWLISIWLLFTFSMIGMRSKLRFPNWLAALLGAASPTGGQWSFDEENRKPLPKDHSCPPIPLSTPSKIEQEVMSLVEKEFPDHPGSSADFWLPTDRTGARKWARNFFDKRFQDFGPYEDAISSREDFVYHSVLTPFLNTGLLTPRECVLAALKTAEKQNIPHSSCEGFIRQVIGWREFIRGIYQNYSDTQESRNHFGHRRKLTRAWYEGSTGIPPLDGVIRKTMRYSYAHHIERLMVVGSLMLLLEVDPKEAHRWFMEMFLDSSDWVMGPNVYGMALFADGGIFATKPYICGSNYYLKMSDYKRGDWCDGVDGLYWGFIEKNKAMFAKNPRMSMMAKSVEKIDPEKFRKISRAADLLRERLTTK